MTTQLLPLAYAITLGTSSVQIVPANPGRRGIIFYNGSANTVAVCPAFQFNGQALAAAINGAGSISIVPMGILTIPGSGIPGGAAIGTAWNGIASGVSTAFTAWEF